MAWDDLRRPWQEHIQAVSRLIDQHSEQYVTTGDRFHQASYDILVDYLNYLKTWIKEQEEEHGADFSHTPPIDPKQLH